MISPYQTLASAVSSADASKRSPRAENPQGEIVAAYCLAKDCLIILGWTDGEVAGEGMVTVAPAGGEPGRFRALSWSRSEEDRERWYVAAVRVAEIGETRAGETLLLHGAAAKGPAAFRLPAFTADATAFAADLRNHASGKLNHAVKFLLETFSSRASRQLTAVSAFLAAILDGASQEDGVVEILGAIEGEGLLLQGWLCRSLAGRQRLLLLGDVLDEHEAICANFARTDLDGRGVGMLALVQPKTSLRTETLRSVYLRSGEGFYRLTVLPNVMRLRDDDAPNHLRAMLPTLQGDEGLQRSLRSAARPRFAGLDTVSTLDQPVRMAVDLAAHVPGVGWYLTGWMLDPAKRIEKVMLRDRSGMAERLDLRWTRIAREDVSAGFRADPLFAGLIGDDLHGFTAFVPHRATEPRAWLELQFSDEHAAFMPFQPVSGEGSEGRKRLLESFDIHKPSARDIVEHHLGPLFHAAKSLPGRKLGHRVLRPRGAALAKPDAALIIPLVDPGVRTKIVVSELASRKPGDGILPVFVCSPALGEASNALVRELAFYRLDAEILLADVAVDHCEALDIGARAADADRLVFMAPSTHPRCANWAADLLSAQANAEGLTIATPSLLYEDWSICYAGIEGMRFLDAAPYAEAAYSRAGYAREALPELGVTPTLAGSLDCCALTRAAYERLSGFSGGYALSHANGLDFFLRLRKAGIRIVWVPQIEAYTLAHSGTQDEYWMRTGELVDGWSLRASWKDRLPPIIDLANGVAPVALSEPSISVQIALPAANSLAQGSVGLGAAAMGLP